MRELRLRLWAEHLGTTEDDPRLDDPAAGLALWRSTAQALDRWHGSGRHGTRPAGHIRAHTPERVTPIERLWAAPLSRIAVDPDGRPRHLRGTTRF